MIFIVRLVMDSSFRVVYPFIPQISSGLKLSITAFSWLLTIRSTSGFLGPVLGVLADRYGRRKVMALGLVSQALGMAGIAISTGWWAAVPMILVGISVNAFLPAQQAYISDMVSFERRGRALASVDISFAFSGMAIMPIIGWLMDSYGWRTPFAILSALSLVAALVIWMFLPAVGERSQSQGGGVSFWQVLKRRNVLAAIVVSTLFFVAVGIFMTFWSIWLSADFDFDAVALGLIATTIGVAELSGATLSGLFIDRVGKRRGSLIALAIGAALFLMIPLIRAELLYVRLMLFICGVVVEFGIVALFPLYGEQAPDARATIFSLVALGNAVGLGIGPPLTSALWDWQGLGAVMIAGALSLILSFIGVWGFLTDKPEVMGSVVQER